MAKRTASIEVVYYEIGKRLRWLREQRNWSAPEFCERLDVHPSTLVAWENAIARPGIAELLRICHALNVPVAMVLADLPIKDCEPPPGLKEKRRETAFKRVEAMRANGQLGKGARSRAKDGKGED
jgi:transcriptional regulator with XRE-family HTH domain